MMRAQKHFFVPLALAAFQGFCTLAA